MSEVRVTTTALTDDATAIEGPLVQVTTIETTGPGPQGPQGEQGPQGPPGPQGNPGTPGADGTDGADGTNGESAYQIALDHGFVGTEAAWLASLTGPQGPQGDPGTPGTPGADGADGVVQAIVQGAGIVVDATDPANPIVSATAASAVQSVTATDATITVDNADPANPTVGVTAGTFDADGAAAAAQTAAVASANTYTDGAIASEVSRADGAYASAAQGAEADTAVQPGDLATVATTGAYADLSGKPTLGSAAAAATTDFDAAGAADAKVIDSIADADATHAPSRNAVFDALALKAPLASPALTGAPTAPTQAAADNSTKIATTAYADAAASTAADAKVLDSIADADTSHAPSRNAVFDALAGKVDKSLFDANTILAATTDDTPAALTVAASTFLGRKASGNITAMSVAEAITLLALTSAGISDFTEAVQDVIGALLVSGLGIDFTYNDAGNAETVAAYQAARGINTQTASYTLVLGDAGKHVRMNVASANNLTVPDNASVAYPVGTVITGIQLGAGQTTLVAAGGVTLNNTPGLKIAARYGSFGLVKVGTDEWDVMGRLSA